MFNSLVPRRALLFQPGADRIKLASRTELFVFVCYEIGVLLSKDLPRRPEIELFGLIAEVFAMNARPDEPAIGVDVHFSEAQPVRIMPSSMRLSAYFLAPFESWMMNGARLWTFPPKRPSNCSMLLML